MIWPIEIYIAWRYIRYNLRQSLIVALAVGIGVSIIIFIPSVNLSFFNFMLKRTVENAPHILVTREIETLPRNRRALDRLFPTVDQIVITDRTTTRERNINAYQSVTDQLMRVPDVTAAAPYITEQIIIVHGTQVEGVQVRGIIPEREQQVSTIGEEVQEGDLDTMGPNDIFLGWRLADNLDVIPGNRVQLVTAEGDQSFKVAGLINTGILEQDESTALITLQAAQQLLDMPGAVNGIGLKIQDIYQAQDIAKRIESRYELKAESWMEKNEVILDQISNFRVIIAIISFLIVFAAASSITSILIMVVASKSKEIGILKAMGTRAGSILRLFLLQAVFLSILGSIAGVFGAIGLIALYNASPFSRGETVLGISREPVSLNIEYTYIAIFYAVLSSILASLIPAWRAGRLDPVKAINQ